MAAKAIDFPFGASAKPANFVPSGGFNSSVTVLSACGDFPSHAIPIPAASNTLTTATAHGQGVPIATAAEAPGE